MKVPRTSWATHRGALDDAGVFRNGHEVAVLPTAARGRSTVDQRDQPHGKTVSCSSGSHSVKKWQWQHTAVSRRQNRGTQRGVGTNAGAVCGTGPQRQRLWEGEGGAMRGTQNRGCGHPPQHGEARRAGPVLQRRQRVHRAAVRGDLRHWGRAALTRPREHGAA
jgi:hypothetical protein